MISYLLTSYQEPSTIGRAIEAIINQKNRFQEWEVLVAAPDRETLDAADAIKNKYRYIDISIYQDEGVGKPAALNLLFSRARGNILILTDGDVWIDEYATEKLLLSFRPEPQGEIEKSHLMRNEAIMRSLDFADVTLGMTETLLVAGHPFSINSRNTLFGFWSHLLTQSADYKRRKLSEAGHYFDASGYLYAVKKESLFNRHPELDSARLPDGQGSRNKQQKEKDLNSLGFLDSSSKTGMTEGATLPKDILVDDSYITHLIYEQHRNSNLTNFAMAKNVRENVSLISYAPEALVYVKFPMTFSDWMKQKIRSTGGYLQIQRLFPRHTHMRSFWQEVEEFFIPLKFVRSPKEFFWLILLYFARLFLWIKIFYLFFVRKPSFSSLWTRIESTK